MAEKGRGNVFEILGSKLQTDEFSNSIQSRLKKSSDTDSFKNLIFSLKYLNDNVVILD